MTELQSSDPRTLWHGLWLPLVTPFRNGALDETSLRRLVRHYAALPVDGLILAATTGESSPSQIVITPREKKPIMRGSGASAISAAASANR